MQNQHHAPIYTQPISCLTVSAEELANMIKLLVLCCITAAVFAAPQNDPKIVPILLQENVVNPDGSFHYKFETGDGTVEEEDGHLEKATDPKEEDSVAVQGKYSYKTPEGETVEVTYTADKNGYRAEGSHIPKIPEAIARALEYIAANPPPPSS